MRAGVVRFVVEQIWPYPVKSIGGERIGSARAGR
jgi:uncharacterized protein YcbX